MIHKEDLKQIRNRGIDLAQVTKQLEDFCNGFPYLKIKCAATPKRGIVVLGESDISEVCRTWEEYQSSGHKSLYQPQVQQVECSRIYLLFLMEIMTYQQLILKNIFLLISIILLSMLSFLSNV